MSSYPYIKKGDTNRILNIKKTRNHMSLVVYGYYTVYFFPWVSPWSTVTLPLNSEVKRSLLDVSSAMLLS